MDRDDPLAAATAYVVATDRDLQTRIRALLDRVLDEAEELLVDGIPQVKLGLMRSLTPHLVRELRNQIDESDEIRVLKAEMRALMAEVRTGRPDVAAKADDVVQLLADEPR